MISPSIMIKLNWLIILIRYRAVFFFIWECTRLLPNETYRRCARCSYNVALHKIRRRLKITLESVLYFRDGTKWLPFFGMCYTSIHTMNSKKENTFGKETLCTCWYILWIYEKIIVEKDYFVHSYKQNCAT